MLKWSVKLALIIEEQGRRTIFAFGVGDGEKSKNYNCAGYTDIERRNRSNDTSKKVFWKVGEKLGSDSDTINICD